MDGHVEPNRLRSPYRREGVQYLLNSLAIFGVVAFAIHRWNSGFETDPTLNFHQRGSGSAGTTRLLRVDLNTASVHELSLLPAVGPILARRIIENRDRWGHFQSLDDLGRVHGVGEKTIAGLREFCEVRGPFSTHYSDMESAAAPQLASQQQALDDSECR